jgi:hypothetical protein
VNRYYALYRQKKRSMYDGDFFHNEYVPEQCNKKDDICGNEKCYIIIVGSVTDRGELLLYCTGYVEIRDAK